MAALPFLDTPARLPEPTDADRKAWSDRVGGIVAGLAADFPRFFDPTATGSDTGRDTGSDTGPHDMAPAVVWNAFPATLLQGATSEEQRWRAADASRDVQDEYCEWSVERDPDGVVTRVTFTTEVREWFEHLAERDPDRLLATYRELTGRDVRREQLFRGAVYQPANALNRSTTGRLVHLVQRNNNLQAALALAAQATVLRHDRAGRPVTGAQELVRCSRLGEPLRNSDPQIAGAVNDAAATGAEVSLQDPMGLYIDRFVIGGMETPDGEDPAAFWTVERGTPGHALRAGYAVPPDRGYRVGDVTADGRPIRFGAQLADRVFVRLTALVHPAGHPVVREPCLAG